MRLGGRFCGCCECGFGSGDRYGVVFLVGVFGLEFSDFSLMFVFHV